MKLLNDNFNRIRTHINEAERKLRDHVEVPINAMVSDVQNAHKASLRLANSADLYLQSNNEDDLLNEADGVIDNLRKAMRETWPVDKISEVLTTLTEAETYFEAIRISDDRQIVVSKEAWAEWFAVNEDRYQRAKERITELQNKVNTVNGGIGAFNDSKNILADWEVIINNVTTQREAAFRQEAFVSCHNDEGETQSSKLTISKTDRTVANPSATTREVLTVNCYSRVAITGGFNFSTLDEKEFSVVQSAGPTPGTVVKKFGFTNKSSFRPNPLALMNVRFTDNPVYNWHASFGAVVDLKGQTGTDVEPVAGVSFSIRRLIFITPFAVHFGRVTKLAGDFKVGDIVPDAVATPPLEKAWKVGYTTGVTFRIAPQ